ncbi:MAG: hypothetical protein JWM27_3068 [Gemmatimonadetes bacterium]|nr:hypothetical protein [Gemmatimonadota bacterium]
MKHALRHLLGLAPALALVLAAGCSEAGMPTQAPAPAGDAIAFRAAPLFSSAPGGPDLTRIARFSTRPQATSGWVKAWIGPAGGRVDFLGFAIQVPAGAVDRVTMFSIRVPQDPYGSDHAVAEFGPHNVTFRRPIQIETPYRNTTVAGSPTQVLWWDESLAQWTSMGGTISADGLRLVTKVPHFSTYGTSEAYFNGGLASSGG